jgi:hypothetical protein
VSQDIPIDGLRSATTRFNDIDGTNRSWNEHDRYCSLAGTNGHDLLSLSPMSHGLGTPATGNPSRSYFYSDHEDRAAGTSPQNIHLLADRLSNVDSSTAVSYYSRLLPLCACVVNCIDTVCVYQLLRLSPSPTPKQEGRRHWPPETPPAGISFSHLLLNLLT